jgi:hypothetical protein
MRTKPPQAHRIDRKAVSGNSHPGYRPAGAFIAASDRLINPMSSESVESSRLVSFEITDL